MPDVSERTEGFEKLTALAAQGTPKKRSNGKGPKTDWVKVNIRMEPKTKARLKTIAKELQVPVEELVHVALVQFLDALDNDEIELSFKPVTTRQTIL